MLAELARDVAVLALMSAGFYVAMGIYLQRRPQEHGPSRLLLLAIFVLIAATLEVAEEVLEGDSGPADKAILLFVHGHTPEWLVEFFKTLTFSGSSRFLVPLTVIFTLLLLAMKRRTEAALLALSFFSAELVVFVVKTVVGRERPSLWETDWYWGSSFPSGHTLGTAAFATAAAVCIARTRPTARRLAIGVALTWIALVGVSRMVLGVHWPSDVLVAAGTGCAIALGFSVLLRLRRA